jgi:hypothetical protein
MGDTFVKAMSAGLMAAALASVPGNARAAATSASPATTAMRIRVGVDAHTQPPSDADVVRTAVRAALVTGAVPAIDVVPGCKDVTFCLTVVTLPIKVGGRTGGMAVAGYVSRRLVVRPDWPWPHAESAAAPSPSAPVRIEDTYTSGGSLACAGCQAELDALRRQVAAARTLTADTMVDEGDLQILIGPSGEGFLKEAAASLAGALRDRHMGPWLASLSGNN